MKMNYPIHPSSQSYEAKTRNFRDGVQRLMSAAGVQTDRLKTVLDLGCRFGDSTLGILRATPSSTQVIAVEEFIEATALAKWKFNTPPTRIFDAERGLIPGLLKSLPEGWVDFFRQEASSVWGREYFAFWPIKELGNLAIDEVDLVVAFQTLHWLDAGPDGLPDVGIIRSIRDMVLPGGLFVGGTSTAFFDFGKADVIEGMPRSVWSIHEHPFMKIVFEEVARLMAVEIGKAPEPVSAKPSLSAEGLKKLFESNGFGNLQFGHFLIKYSLDVLTTETARNVPLHQGRLNGVSDFVKARIIDCALGLANAKCDRLVGDGAQDPRLVADRNVYEAVPWLRATAV
jgi:SAM-dependent methyltransferase